VRSPYRARVAAFGVCLALASFVLVPVWAGAAAARPAPPSGTCGRAVEFKASNFGRSTKIDNRFLPLKPGTQLVLEGRSNVTGQSLPHTVTFTVTDLVKRIDGVWNLVMWDVDISDGVVTEAELAFFAQDKEGNVWSMGEYPEEYQDGKFVGAPNTWISGQGATPGIHMLEDPLERLGGSRYLQGYVPGIDFLDCAKVFAKDQTAKVPAGTYRNVLVTDETSPLEDPNAHQRKYHAPGVGIVQVGAANDPQGETLVLTKINRLSGQALSHAREQALKLERRAYQVSREYKTTAPAQQCTPLKPRAKLLPNQVAPICPGDDDDDD
jgi:hypothetical protein